MKALKLAALVAALFCLGGLVAAATASSGHHHPHGTPVCYHGSTVYVDGGLGAVWLYLYRHPGATVGACAPVTTTEPPPTTTTTPEPPPPVVSGPAVGYTYLCYSRFPQSTPGVYLLSDAPALVAQGLTVPFAISEELAVQRGIPSWAWSVVDGRVLVCNISGLQPTGESADPSDTTRGVEETQAFERDYAGYRDGEMHAPNLYPIAG